MQNFPDLGWKISKKPTFYDIGEMFHFLSAEFSFLRAEFWVVYYLDFRKFSSAKFAFSERGICFLEEFLNFDYRGSV